MKGIKETIKIHLINEYKSLKWTLNYIKNRFTRR